MDRIRVKLKKDLTQYAENLVAGSIGYTAGRQGMWSRGNDNFITVYFPDIATFDVLWAGLEIIDEEYLKKLAVKKAKKAEEYKTATDVVLNVGPRGGFKYLSFSYCGGSTCTGFKEEADEIIEIFKENNISIEKRIVK